MKEQGHFVAPQEQSDHLDAASSKVQEFFTPEEYRYIQLKTKFERGQKMSDEEFDEMQARELMSFTEENQPFSEEFSPHDELQKIRAVPLAERRDALERFKKDRLLQKKALAQMQIAIEDRLVFDPETPIEKMQMIVDSYGSQYGFDKHQNETITHILEQIDDERTEVASTAARNPDTRQLFEAITGCEPQENAIIDIEQGVLQFTLYVDEHTATELEADKRLEGVVTTTMGFAQTTAPGKPLYNVVNIGAHREKMQRYNRNLEHETAIHEERHQINAVIGSFFEEKFGEREREKLSEWFEDETDPASKEMRLITLLEAHRKHAFFRVKDEVLARLTHQTVAECAEDADALYLKHDNSAYDFVSDIGRPFARESKRYKKITDKILCKEYDATVREALAALHILADNGFRNEEIRALLGSIELPQWPKEIARLHQRKESRK